MQQNYKHKHRPIVPVPHVDEYKVHNVARPNAKDSIHLVFRWVYELFPSDNSVFILVADYAGGMLFSTTGS